MAVAGVFASDQNIVGTRRGDFASAILQVMPTGSAPLLALSAGMETKPANDTIVTWFEENHVSGRVQVSSFVTDGDGTGFVLTDASSFVVGTILLNDTTGEYVFVTAVSGNTITVTRGFAGSTAVTVTTSHFFQRIGTGHEEGSARPVAIANLGFPRYNYVQIFRNAWNLTGTAMAVEYITGSIIAKNKADAANYHAEDIERSIIWGRRQISVLNSQPFRTMDGINSQITTNVSVGDANMQWSEIDLFLRNVFSRNIRGKPNERIGFCGNTVLGVLNEIAIRSSVVNIEPGQTQFGMNVSKWITPYGNISLLTHPLMNESPVWTQELYVYHPGAIRTRYLRRTHEDNYDKDGSRAGVDADFGVITTEMTVEYRAELTGGRYTAISGASTTQP